MFRFFFNETTSKIKVNSVYKGKSRKRRGEKKKVKLTEVSGDD